MIQRSTVLFTPILLALLAAATPICAFAQPVRSEMSFQSAGQPPIPPTGLKLGYYSKIVTLSWVNVAAPAVSEFHIFRFDNYAPDKTLAEVGKVIRNNPTAPSYAYYDRNIQPGHTYTYFITCKDRFGLRGNNSKMVTITLPSKF